ncbi:MAG: lactate utilization protein [Gemmataceae bacterium]
MNSDREAFLERVRRAVAEGNRAGTIPPLPDRGSVGYQGAGPDPVARLEESLTAAGGVLHRTRDATEALAAVVRLIQERQARLVLVGDGPVTDALALEAALPGVEVRRVSALEPGRDRSTFFAADIGVTGVDHVIVETGTIVQATRPGQPRAVSLLVPVHIAVARRSDLLPDLFDLLGENELPACLSLITGPSKTGDIELRLVTGVHGPGEVHLVLIENG